MNYEFLIFVTIAICALYFVAPESLKSVIEDFKFIFSPGSWQEIKRERLDKHFYYTFFIVFTAQAVFSWLHMMQFDELLWYESLFLTTFGSLMLNFCREGYLQYKKGRDNAGNWIPFSWRDIRFGVYGGFIASIVSSIIF